MKKLWKRIKSSKLSTKYLVLFRIIWAAFIGLYIYTVIENHENFALIIDIESSLARPTVLCAILGIVFKLAYLRQVRKEK